MVAIKDMKMPSSCANCELCINGQYGELTCALLGEEWEETDYNSDHRDENCPLIEIEESKQREINWIPLIWDKYPTVDMDGNDDYVYAVDYSVPMPKEDEWVLITDENHNVRAVQYDGYDFGDYVREEILAWAHSPMPYKD